MSDEGVPPTPPVGPRVGIPTVAGIISYGVAGASVKKRAQLIISKDTPILDIIDALTEHGCRDLTADLDSALHTAHPVSQGGCGDVYRSTLRPQIRVAIKALRVSIDADDEPGRIPKRAARELYTWSRCSHPNILPLLGLAAVHDQLSMVSLWMDNGSLPGYLEKNPHVNRYGMCTQICNGLEYLHDSVQMIHGDMKGQNVLVSDEGIPMITDFGNAVLQYGDLQFTQTKNMAGFTPRWTAPEILYNAGDSNSEDEGNSDEGGNQDDEEKRTITQSEAADVYALGMTILEIITGNMPYAEKNNEMALIYLIISKKLIPKRPTAHIPSTPRGDAVWSLLTSCWGSDPGERPTARQVAETVKRIADGVF